MDSDKEKTEETRIAATRAIKNLAGHMDEFVNVFSEDRDRWRGEAASLEQGFVSSDKEYMDEMIREMEILIGAAGEDGESAGNE